MAIRGTKTSQRWVASAASVATLFLGLFLLKISILDVLAAAKRHEPWVTLGNGSLVAPLFVIAGLVAVAANLAPRLVDRGPIYRLMADPQTGRLSQRGMVVVIVVAGLSVGVHLWLRSELQSLGYAV